MRKWFKSLLYRFNFNEYGRIDLQAIAFKKENERYCRKAKEGDPLYFVANIPLTPTETVLS